MRHYRPLTPDQEKVLSELARGADDKADREALQREIYELENSRVPLYRLALERLLFRRLVKAARESPAKSRALARVLNQIPHFSSSAEWAKMAPGERLERMYVPHQEE